MQKTLVKKKKISISLIIDFIVGYYRYFLFYSRFNYLLRNHIKEQIDFRISMMNPKCFISGSCIACGCDTTALQMCNRACDKNCYPKMMSKEDWLAFRKLMSKSFDEQDYIDLFGEKNFKKLFPSNNFESRKHLIEQHYRIKLYFDKQKQVDLDIHYDELFSEDLDETKETPTLDKDEEKGESNDEEESMKKIITEFIERDEKPLEES